MPKLNTVIEIGFCSGYGDGDYRVSSSVSEMSQKKYDELRIAVLGALNCADRMRQNYRERTKTGEFEAAAADDKKVS